MSGEKVNSSRWEEVLRSQYGKLAIAMQNPSPVAGLLWQENLISDDVKNRVLFSNASPNERASILLNNIQALLSASKEPEKVMRTFCGALKHSQEPPIMEIASKMIIAANLLVDDGERSEGDTLSQSFRAILKLYTSTCMHIHSYGLYNLKVHGVLLKARSCMHLYLHTSYDMIRVLYICKCELMHATCTCMYIACMYVRCICTYACMFD